MKTGTRLLVGIAVLACTPVALSRAAVGGESAREKDKLGVIVDFWGTPAPSPAGLSLAYNLKSWLRLDAGVAGYNDSFNPYDYSIRPLLYPVFFVAGWILETVFYVPFTGHYSGLGYSNFQFAPPGQILTYSTGGNLFVPGWNLSPTIGVHVSRYTASGVPNLASGSHVLYSYTLGFDWQLPMGVDTGLGLIVCAPGQSVADCDSGYVSLGFFF